MASRPNSRQKIFDFASLFILSLATLTYEINLTRIFSVTQYYHFAFLIIGFAMFGFGASGVCLTLFPNVSQRKPRLWMAGFSSGMAITCCSGYILINQLPFDSFSIAWDWHQVFILALHSLVLSLPFFCSGAMLNVCFALYTTNIGQVYAVNLIGSACGCLLAMVLPSWIGGDGVIWFSAFLSILSAVSCLQFSDVQKKHRILVYITAFVLNVSFILILVLKPPFFELQLSPYKGLSYAKQYPDSNVLSERWNGYSRVDVVSSDAIRSIPGLSYLYNGPLPSQKAVFVDGDGLSGISELNLVNEEELAFTDFLPSAIAYQLRPSSKVLILEPRGGLEVWTAIRQGSDRITIVESNSLITAAAPEVYNRTDVEVVSEDKRSFTRKCDNTFDVISLPLTSPHHPIRSGAYTLVEDYGQTTQAYVDYLTCLAEDGLLVITKWLQTPPSESLRVFTTLVTALEDMGLSPGNRIVAYRGYNTMTFIVSRNALESDIINTIRLFLKARAFDLVFAPDIQPDEINVHNILPDAIYYQYFIDFITSDNRKQWYRQYPFNVTPTTDIKPFFGHFFKLSQARQILSELGKTWQPFGGAGYFVIIILLILSLCAAGILIMIPAAATRVISRHKSSGKCRGLVTYGLIGLAFMFVEIPLTQRFILYLGHPAYAMTTVLFTILIASGAGSLYAEKVHLRSSLLWVVGLGIATSVGFEIIFITTLRYALTVRILITILLLFPLGVVMGMPFSQGIRAYKLTTQRCIAYAWGVNGATSVVATVLAAFLALTADFRVVFFTGLFCYGAAALYVFRVKPTENSPPLPQ